MGFFDRLKKKINSGVVDPMYEGAVVLLYNLSKEKGLPFEIMCENLGVEVVYVKKEDYLQPVGALAGISKVKTIEESYQGEGFEEIMAVMKNFTGMSMSHFKDKMRRTNGVAEFDLETTINDKNLNMNSIEIRNLLYEQKQSKAQKKTLS